VSWGKEDDEDDSDGEGEEDSETAGAGGKRKRVAAAAVARPRWGDELAPLMIPGPLKHRRQVKSESGCHAAWFKKQIKKQKDFVLVLLM
jgi:hypothetical protein